MVTGASQHLLGWSKLVKVASTGRKKGLQAYCEYSVSVKPEMNRSAEEHGEKEVPSLLICAWRNLCTHQYCAKYRDVLPYISVSSACLPFVMNASCICLPAPLKDRWRGVEERQDSKLYLSARGPHPVHRQCLFSCCRSNIGSCGGVGSPLDRNPEWLLKVESCVCVCV